jgi:hypothetical protein
MLEVNYKISLHKGKTPARWNINKNKGDITLYISNIWEESESYISFIYWLIYSVIIERVCLERAFNKIRVKGGRCNPCCVKNVASKMFDIL